MASIHKNNLNNGGHSYTVRYRDPTGASRQETFRRRVDADHYAALAEADKLRGMWVDPARGATTVRRLVDQFLAGRSHLRPSSQARDESYVRNHILPHFGDRRIDRIQPSDIQEWLSGLLASGKAPATARKAYQLLGAIFRVAVDNDLIVRTPCRGIVVPQPELSEMRFLTRNEVAEVADAADGYRLLVVAAAYTGARWGELAGMRPEALNLLNGTWTVTRTVNEVRGNILVGPPKTAASRRTITLPEFLIEALSAHIKDAASSYVFTAPEGGPLRGPNFRRRVWLPAVRRTVEEPCRFHDLRHTHVAWLIEQGEHPVVIAKRLGHTSTRTVLDRYGHVLPGLDEGAAAALDEQYRRSPVGFLWG